ncbi:MAG: hypothetical protein JSV35_03690 [Candidatus Bathyarchaeota archaeon]|nr:MAG: hypothetical protein JSV35_03690 [Candidatus Bathyarchaeota archaeon]
MGFNISNWTPPPPIDGLLYAVLALIATIVIEVLLLRLAIKKVRSKVYMVVVAGNMVTWLVGFLVTIIWYWR